MATGGDANSNGFINPGDTLQYSVVLNNSGSDATGVVFTDTLNSNLTLVTGSVHASPIAVDEAYNWVGNTQLDTSARGLPSITANDVTVTDSFTVNTTPTSGPSHGSVTISANGHFVYTPAAGYIGDETFTYTISNSADASLTSIVTVTIHMPVRVWYVQNATVNGDGRNNSPFNSPASASTAANVAADIIYIFSDLGANPKLNGNFALDNGQQLLGQGVNLVANSITLFTAGVAPTTTNSSGNGVTLAAGASNPISGFNIGDCSGSAIASTSPNFSTLTVGGVAINNTTGQALNLASGTVAGAGFTSVSSSAGTNNVSLVSVAGTLALGSGTLQGASGAAFSVNGAGSTATITYSGSISKTSAGRIADIQNHSGSNSITLSGTLTCNSGCTGINVASNTGGTIEFSGATKTINTGTNPAVTLSSNSGATINFSGGGLDIDATSGKGINATGGGTINITTGANNNTIDTTTGAAFDANGVTFGVNGVTFKSISANGGTNGIVLNSTSGNFTVTGDGTGQANGSGGAIQNITSSADTNHPIYLKTASGTITLKSINMSIVINTYSGMLVDNNLGGIITVNVTGCTFTGDGSPSNDGQQKALLQFEAGNTGADAANLTANVQNSYFFNNRTYGMFATAVGDSVMDVTLNQSGFGTNVNTGAPVNNPGTTITNPPPFSIGIGNGGNSKVNYNVTNNTFWGARGNSGAVYAVTISGASTTASSKLNGTFSGNKIGKSGESGSGCSNGCAGLGILPGTNGTYNAVVQNNDIRQTNRTAIDVFNSAANSNATMIAKIANNTIAEPDTTGAPTFQRAIAYSIGNSGGSAMSGCLELSGNNISGAWQAGNFIRVTTNNTTGTLTMPGLMPTSGATAAQVETFIASQNSPLTTNDINVTIGGAINGGAACAAPSAAQPIDEPSAPTSQNDRQALLTEPGGGTVPSFSARARQWLKPLSASIRPLLGRASYFNAPRQQAPELATGAKPGWADYLSATVDYGAAISPQLRAAKQLWRPSLMAVSMTRSYFNLFHLFECRAFAAETFARQSLQAPPVANRAGGTALVMGWSGETITVNGAGSGFMLPAGKSTTIKFQATISSGFSSTSILNQAMVTGQPGNFSVLGNNLSTPVIQPPTISKQFGATNIKQGTTTSLTFTLTNPNAPPAISPGTTLTQATFIDTLPTGLVIANPTGLVNNCSGSVTNTSNVALSPGDTSIKLANGSIPANASPNNKCTITVNVTGQTDGAKNNTPGAPDSFESDAGVAGSQVTLNVINAPTFSKSFTPPTVQPSTPSALSFTITNNSPNFPLNGVGFTDLLPNDIVVAAMPSVTGTCFGGTITANPAATSISLSGATLGIMGGGSNSCTFSVNVTAPTPGSKMNSVNLTTTELGSNSSAAPATATLSVIGPPTVMKSFAASPIPVGTNTTMSFKLTNPNASTTLNGVGFSDTLPAGITVVSAATPQCGGTVVTTSSSISFSGGTLAGGAMCTVDVTVLGTQAGSWNNTATNVTSTEGGAGVDSNTATLVVLARPTVAKSFSPPTIAPGGTSTLTITLGNTNNVNLTGGTIPALNTCTLTVGVTSSTPGVHNNTIAVGDLTTTNGGSNTVGASANLTVASPPNISKAFGAASVPLNSTTSLTFTITNPNATVSLSGVSFTDTLPAGLVVAATPNVTGMCNGTVTANAGSNTISLSGGSLGTSPSNTCTISVDVTGTTAGAKPNSVTASASETGAGPVSTTVTLNVFAPPTITKAFSPPSIAVGGTSTLTFTITNPADNPGVLNGLFVNDTFPSDLVVAAPLTTTNTCSGGTLQDAGGGTLNAGDNGIRLTGGMSAAAGMTCTFSVVVTAPTAGAKANTSGNVSSTEGGTNNGAGGTASATLNVFAPPTVVKSFTPPSVAVNGVSTLTITITNPANNPGALTGLSFTDNFPAGLEVDTTPNALNSCNGMFSDASNGAIGGGDTGIKLAGGFINTAGQSCTVSVRVKATTAGQKVNNVTVNSTEAGLSLQAAATLNVAAAPTLSKSFTPNQITVGATATLQFTLNNPNAFGLSGIQFTDTLPAGVTVTSGGPTATCGGTLSRTAPSTITFTGGALTASGSCNFSVTVTGAQAEAWTNMTGAISSTESGAGSTAMANITIIAPPQISKAFSPTSILTGATATLTFTLTNPAGNTVALNGVGFTDNLPAGLQVASPNNLGTNCSGGTAGAVVGSSVISLSGATINPNNQCTVIANVTATSAGAKNNVSNAVSSTNGGTGNTASATLTVTCPAITINPATLPNGGVGVAYTATNFSATGGGGTYSFSVSSGTLPMGLNLTGNTLSGTPTEGGTFNLTSKATDQFGCMGTRNYTLVINRPPVLAPIGNKSVPPGQTLTFTAMATDPDSSDILTYSLLGAPAGAAINPSTGQFAWTPTAAQIGPHTFTVKVTDNGNPQLSDSETITVNVSNLPPTLTLSVSYLNTNPTNVGLSAQLKDSFTNNPIPGKIISFTIGTQTVTGTTDGNGVAMAAFIIRALHPPGYIPPTPAMQRFLDVPPSNPFYAHIEEMAVRNITQGCGGNNYCPAVLVTRAQMAVFLVRAFNL